MLVGARREDSRGRRGLRERNSLAAYGVFGVSFARRPGAVRIPALAWARTTKAWQGVAGAPTLYREKQLRPFLRGCRKKLLPSCCSSCVSQPMPPTSPAAPDNGRRESAAAPGKTSSRLRAITPRLKVAPRRGARTKASWRDDVEPAAGPRRSRCAAPAAEAHRRLQARQRGSGRARRGVNWGFPSRQKQTPPSSPLASP